MSEHNWCHGPDCHTYSTVDRVRGVKGNKVLRTRKVKVSTLVRQTIVGIGFVVMVVSRFWANRKSNQTDCTKDRAT